eukprot:Seg411.3 transcript_id=Seg411.3/GoldUCD/mRNA.D3Y31 product="hypothetical protein" protein_id=Seg411.3/GoldUCD/D3Y31
MDEVNACTRESSMVSGPEMDSEIIKAIPQIRKKGKRPWLEKISLQIQKEGISCEHSEIEHAIQRLEQNGKIEDRGKDGNTSYFLRDSKEESIKTNKKAALGNSTGLAPYSEFVQLRETLISLRKIIDENITLRNRNTEKNLKEEIMLLRKENDPLRNYIMRKDLLIKSFEKEEESRKDDSSFQLPKRSAMHVRDIGR